MAGGNYNITLTQVLESEKKLRIESILGFHSARYGNIKFSADMIDCKGDSVEMNGEEVDKNFYSVLDDDYLGNNQVDSSGLLYICGYIAFKGRSKTNCDDCTELLCNK